jgi:hypothetical protein
MGTLWNLEGGSFERGMKRALELESLSHYGSSVREAGVGNPFLGTLEDMWKRLWRRAFLSIGVSLGELGRGHASRGL